MSIAYSLETNYCVDFIKHVYGGDTSTKTNSLPSNHGMIKACLEGKVRAVLPVSLISEHLKTGRLVDLVPGEFLNIDLYWYVSKFIASVLPDVTNTVMQAARENLGARSSNHSLNSV